ncbi:TetR/AcrR family transcriptional regulator [Paenibacillus thiaminolyticus]|uniref:TetR/AcrR family transcriptional regulator n=1 Tax=Paenibacillus thiaminolyticus TaxID=49283 RepID=UPI00232F1AE5|nr:TetR/AcrR family transcriptional regulator [Paenibacillus thiaminolyticus]WCF07294.1 TetR/AcrR family transcriptional regulator [Paenibacillus thiaminolyticus]
MPGISKHQTDPRIRRTRQLIKDAFVALLQEMDIEKMSISSIAERATISRVTFYLHYRDIPDMLDKMADEMIEDLQHAMNNPALPISPEDKDWLRLVKMLEHIAENAPFYKVILGSRRTHIFTERLLQMFTELITARFENRETASSGSRAVIQKDIAIWYGSSALIGTIVGWLRNDMPYTPAFLAKQLYLLNTRDL